MTGGKRRLSLRPLAPGGVDRLTGGDLEGDVLDRSVVARGHHELEPREPWPQAVDDALISRRLPADGLFP